MRAQHVIVVTAGRVTANAGSRLDSLVREILRLGKTPVVVLGPDGDDLLRTCTQMENCEIVFDPNYEGEIFSSVQAGLHAAQSASYVVVLGEPLIALKDWADFEEIHFRDWTTGNSTVQVLRAEGERLYPQFITAHGAKTLKDLPASTSWVNSSQINVRTVAIANQYPDAGFPL